jgi:hypothetical protein
MALQELDQQGSKKNAIKANLISQRSIDEFSSRFENNLVKGPKSHGVGLDTKRGVDLNFCLSESF